MMVEDMVSTSGDISIKEAILILHNRHIGSIVIVGQDGKCKGIFTERDAIRVVATDVPLSTPLREVMTTNLKTVKEGATFAEVKNIMRTHNIRHLPVVDEQGRIIGLLSLRRILDEVHDLHVLKP
jgi:CBS domain-containing protein